MAVLGGGTVGSEVIRAFDTVAERLETTGGPRLELVGIAVRHLGGARPAWIDEGLLTDAPAHLVAAPDTDIIVELMGGDEPARTLIAAALGAGKAVVTANKHVIAHHGPALEAVARRTGAPLRFEAAVGGGIPVLGPIASDLAANRISRIRGIVNGTTNYILSEMAAHGREYAQALEAAQAAGYAEADPSGDVEGMDAANKLAILCRLAFGAWFDPDLIARRPPTVGGQGPPGITTVSREAVAGAAALGGAIKLVADTRRSDDGRVMASVLPTLVPLQDPLARVGGVTNRIEVKGEPVGNLAFTGPGAGGAATSSAVLGDVLAIARGGGSTWAGLPPAEAVEDAPADGPESAHDRGWFAVLAGVDGASTADDRIEVANIPGGIAVHAPRQSLAEMRRLLAAVGGSPEVVVYPADERAART